jgi:hypothetical protein
MSDALARRGASGEIRIFTGSVETQRTTCQKSRPEKIKHKL